MRSSPIVRSPLTVNTNTYDIRRTTSPRNFTSSPSPRLHSESPVRNFSSSTALNSSSNSKLNSETYRVTTHTYKSSINHSASPIPSTMLKDETVEFSPLTTPVKPSAARRDSWDVLNKTKHMFSNNSIESLTNLTDKQLDSKNMTSVNRSNVDSETQMNTQYNKYLFSDSSRKERSEKYVSKTSSNDYDYSTKFVPINETIEGAKGIKVTNKPDGYLGQPFEFESE
jgi:filamin